MAQPQFITFSFRQQSIENMDLRKTGTFRKTMNQAKREQTRVREGKKRNEISRLPYRIIVAKRIKPIIYNISSRAHFAWLVFLPPPRLPSQPNSYILILALAAHAHSTNLSKFISYGWKLYGRAHGKYCRC